MVKNHIILGNYSQMPENNSLCVEILEEQLRNLSIAPSRPKMSDLQILDFLCQEHVKMLNTKSFDSTDLLDEYIKDETGELILPNLDKNFSDILNSIISDAVKIGDESARLRNSDLVIDLATNQMMKILISMIQCLIDESNCIPVSILSVIYENQILVVSTMLNNGWGKKLPDTWKEFENMLRKKKEVLNTFMISKNDLKLFLNSPDICTQFQVNILFNCVSSSVGYEIVMPAIQDAWLTLFNLERYVLDKIKIEKDF